NAVDEIVALARPVRAYLRVAYVVLHRARARREEGEIRAALALQFQLCALERVLDLLIGDLQLARLLAGDLLLAPVPEGLRCGGVVAVAIDDHVIAAAVAVLFLIRS